MNRSALTTTLTAIAERAGIPDQGVAAFVREMVPAIADACNNPNADPRPFKRGDVRKVLATMVADAAALRTLLVEGRKAQITEAQSIASHFLNAALVEQATSIPHFVSQLSTFEDSARAALNDAESAIPAGRPNGSGNQAFDAFVITLFLMSRCGNPGLTVYKDNISGSPSGQLLPALETLRPHLPQGFIPERNRLGNIVLQIISNTKEHQR